MGAELKPQAKDLMADDIKKLSGLQEILAAQDRWGLLLILQGMDASGKDGTIKHVMSGANPQGVDVWSFKEPSAEELNHDYFWRTWKCLPERGQIGIFNRSYYEEVLVVRVHRQVLQNEKLPKASVTKHIWRERFEDINNFERYLTRNGIVVVKFFLHLSKEEQKRRFMERLDTPGKRWKFSASDVKEREFWDAYQDAYEDAIRHTASEAAPWYVVPADNKWFAHLVVANAVVDVLDGLKLKYPKLSGDEKAALAQARRQLENE